MSTLIVDEIVSVGAVDTGDNPKANILFWKKRGKESAIVASASADSAGLPEEQGMPLDIEKASPEQLRGLVVKQREQLAAEFAKRRDAEFIAKVKDTAGLETLLGGKAEDLGPALRRLDDAAPDAFAQVWEPLAAAAAKFTKSALLKELGGSDTLNPDTAKAAYIAKKKEAGDTRPDSELAAEFWRENPDMRLRSREV